ncbi:MAG: Mrp/NBP35 family ATP-binding protein [Desulfurococcus sp.]|nr:Mrp/NBP35 family ATP-binding protein [Desulfurococcus sp.]
MSSQGRRAPITPVFKLVDEAKKRLAGYKYKIVILSGKGGVGKTFVSTSIALGLAIKGKRVAILDADIHGSSIPLMMGVQKLRLYADENGNILPVEGPRGVKIVAINLMLDSPDLPVVWRGPLVSKAITELLSKVSWGEGDYMVIDMPPGTGDAAITVAQTIPDISGAIIVTAPNILTETIVAKTVNFAVRNKIRLLGIIENMSYFKCPVCGSVHNLLGKSTGEYLASKYGTRLLGKIPLDPLINEAVDRGEPYLLAYPEGEAAKAVMMVVEEIIKSFEGNESS